MSIATNSYADIQSQYLSAIEWMRALGVYISLGRTQSYEKVLNHWIQHHRTASDSESREIFPDFTSSIFEIMDFLDIYHSLREVPHSQLQFIASKLQKGVNGPINLASETSESSEARNFIFEALVAAFTHKPQVGIETIFETISDTGFTFTSRRVLVECKRITSREKLEANIRKACNQLESAFKREISSQSRGLVAIDFTKIVNPGDSIYVKSNDGDLIEGLNSIMDEIVRKYSHEWQKVYGQKSSKVIGTLIRYSTMATSEERSLLVRASQWALNPRDGLSDKNEDMLKGLAKSLV